MSVCGSTEDSDMTQDDVVQEIDLSKSYTPPQDALQTRVVESKCRRYLTVFILFMINLLNYMDRFTVSAVLLQIQEYFHVGNSDAGLLATSFVCSYMLLSPVFGFMGDRYSRKIIMCCGVLFWSIVTLGGSFVEKDQFWLFLFLRACVGVGEASYSTIAPTIIADLFVKEQRTNMLAMFYFAIPVGSGLGYIVGANVADLFGDWKYALRVTPILGVICVVLITVLVREPERGEAEGTGHVEAGNWCSDVYHLLRNKSFVYCTLGFTCVTFVAGALSFWAPPFMVHSINFQRHHANSADVALIFGIITCLAGIIGVAVGSQSARFLKRNYPQADPVICAVGLLLCAPFLFLSLVAAEFNTTLTWILIFFGEVMLCLNWSIVADIVLYVVIPTRRSTAEAFQILLSHLLGDAGSPYLIGIISDQITFANSQKSARHTDFTSLQYALYSTTFMCVIGGLFFLFCSLYVCEDQKEVEKVTKSPLAAIEEAGVENDTYKNSTTSFGE